MIPIDTVIENTENKQICISCLSYQYDKSLITLLRGTKMIYTMHKINLMTMNFWKEK